MTYVHSFSILRYIYIPLHFHYIHNPSTHLCSNHSARRFVCHTKHSPSNSLPNLHQRIHILPTEGESRLHVRMKKGGNYKLKQSKDITTTITNKLHTENMQRLLHITLLGESRDRTKTHRKGQRLFFNKQKEHPPTFDTTITCAAL